MLFSSVNHFLHVALEQKGHDNEILIPTVLTFSHNRQALLIISSFRKTVKSKDVFPGHRTYPWVLRFVDYKQYTNEQYLKLTIVHIRIYG